MVVADPHPTTWAALSERKNGTYLLPVATSYETSGSRTSSNRAIQWGEQIVKPIFECKQDYEAIYLLARKLGRPICVVLYGSSYWREIVNFEALVRHGAISAADLGLFHHADDPDTGPNDGQNFPILEAAVADARPFLEFRLNRILDFTTYTDGVEIIKDAGRNPVLLFDQDIDIFCLTLDRLLRELSA